MCADTYSRYHEDASSILYDDTSSSIYSTVSEATKNASLQNAIPARETTAAQKELKIEVSTGPGLCCKENEAYETRKTTLYKYLDYEKVKQKTKKRRNNKITLLCPVKFAFAVIFIFAMIVVVSMVIALFVQMKTLQEMSRELQKSVEKLNHDKNIVKEQTNQSHLYNLVLSINNKIKHFNVPLINVPEAVNDFNSAHNNTGSEILTSFSPILHFYLSSCSAIARLNSSYASGNYIVRSSTRVLRRVYCDMNRTFGGNSTGWMRVAELDVNNCPPGLRYEITNSDNTCVVKKYSAGCTEINYPVNNTQYTLITGQIRGYTVRTMDGFRGYRKPRPTNFTDLYNNYLDGVSISTNGQHVWSFAARCNCRNTRNKPSIIGQDYTCDGIAPQSKYNELLWASQQCGKNSTWFYKVLSPTTTDIKVRICRDQNRADEDLAIKTLKIFVQ